MHINKSVIDAVTFIFTPYFAATELTSVLPGVCQSLQCQCPEEAAEKTNKIWMPEVFG